MGAWLGDGVFTNHKSSNKITLSRFFKYLVICYMPPTDPHNNSPIHPPIGNGVSTNLQIEFNYLNLMTVYSIFANLTWEVCPQTINLQTELNYLD